MLTDTSVYEKPLIGAICIDQRVMNRIGGVLIADDFAISVCADIFEMATEATSKGEVFDAVRAADCAAQRMGAETADAFIRECMELCPTLTNAAFHAKLLHEAGNKRRLIDKLLEAIDNCTEDKADDLAADVIGLCQDTLSTENSKHMKKLGDSVSAVLDRVYSEDTDKRVDTGFGKLDAILKGMWSGNLILIGARPAVGKSAFVMSLLENAAKKSGPVLLFSLEMDGEEVAERMIAKASRIELDKLIDRKITDGSQESEAMDCAAMELAKLPLYIDDTPGVTVSQIRARARAIKDLKLIAVDFISIMQSTRRKENRNLELGAISRDLKNLAAELKVPIIALTQLNRAVDDSEMPTLKDIRDSGELEQNANKVIFLWNIDREAGRVGVKVAKNRRGSTGSVTMQFDRPRMTFYEEENRYTSTTVHKNNRARMWDEYHSDDDGEAPW